jgi:hypothetical protein
MRPAAHTLQELGVALVLPLPQAMQLDMPALGWYVPALHTAHCCPA